MNSTHGREAPGGGERQLAVAPLPADHASLGALGNGLTQMNVDSYVREIVTGLIIVMAVAASSLGRARQAWRFARPAARLVNAQGSSRSQEDASGFEAPRNSARSA